MTSPDTPVSALMTPNPITVGPDDTIGHAIEVLQAHPFRHLPVVSGDQLVGILSDRDLLLAGTGEAEAQPVSDIMQTDLHTVTPDTPLGVAADLLHRERIGALPILIGSPVQGIVTETDILLAFRDYCRTHRDAPGARSVVREHMSVDPITIDISAPIDEALRLCRESRIRHLPVLDDGHLHGILSDRDIRRGLAALRIAMARPAGEGEPARTRVADVMTKGVMVISPDSALTAAVFTMATNKIGALPVLEGDDLVGVLSQTDVLACYAAAMPSRE